jgi:IS5 family transposase
MAGTLIPFPQSLRPALPTIVGNADYRQLRNQLQRIDELLKRSGIEERFVASSVDQWQQRQRRPSLGRQLNHQLHSHRALRCNILRTLLQEDFRGFAVRLADSPLFQHFCELGEIDHIVVPGKSTLQRYAQWGDRATVDQIMQELIGRAHEQPKRLRLAEAVDLDACFLDTTCLQANIHYPVDWVLLRDATRTLMKAVKLIRAQGLRHRMEEPALFITRMNRLCIEMTHSPKRIDSKRHRKRVLRQMDRLVRSVRDHAARYRQLLDSQWQRTDWSRPQADQVLRRLDAILGQLPAARRQARQRIIREEPVPNEQKILSLYEPDVRVVVRHKAGAEVEFGNKLLLGESRQGLILDWELFEHTVPQDSRLLCQRLARIERNLHLEIKEVAADRGFDSADNQGRLAKRKIYNGVCPRDPHQLRHRMDSWKFARLQHRRSQTEGRIGILLHNFLGQPIRSKGFARRQLAVAWGVLTHNLWVLARLPQRHSKLRLAA